MYIVLILYNLSPVPLDFPFSIYSMVVQRLHSGEGYGVPPVAQPTGAKIPSKNLSADGGRLLHY